MKLKILRLVLEMLSTPSNHLHPTLPPPHFSLTCIHSLYVAFAKHIAVLWRDTQHGCITERLSVSNCWSWRVIKRAGLSENWKKAAEESWSIQTRKVTSCQRRARPTPDCFQFFPLFTDTNDIGNLSWRSVSEERKKKKQPQNQVFWGQRKGAVSWSKVPDFVKKRKPSKQKIESKILTQWSWPLHEKADWKWID